MLFVMIYLKTLTKFINQALHSYKNNESKMVVALIFRKLVKFITEALARNSKIAHI
jgi:hypothetical protein